MKKEEDGIVSEIDHTDILLSGGSDKRRRQDRRRKKEDGIGSEIDRVDMLLIFFC
jgi:hypothetical protein